MRLKVICQVCSRVHTTFTHEPRGPNPWVSYKMTEIIPDLKPALDYEIWICPGCWTALQQSCPEGDPREGDIDMEALGTFFGVLMSVRRDEKQSPKEGQHGE